MKKFIPFFLVLIITMVFFSCKSTSSYEKDVRKMAKLACERQRLNKLVMNGDSLAWNELVEIEKEGEAFVKEMEEKYKQFESDKSMDEKAEKIFKEEMAKCK